MEVKKYTLKKSVKISLTIAPIIFVFMLLFLEYLGEWKILNNILIYPFLVIVFYNLFNQNKAFSYLITPDEFIAKGLFGKKTIKWKEIDKSELLLQGLIIKSKKTLIHINLTAIEKADAFLSELNLKIPVVQKQTSMSNELFSLLDGLTIRISTFLLMNVIIAISYSIFIPIIFVPFGMLLGLTFIWGRIQEIKNIKSSIVMNNLFIFFYLTISFFATKVFARLDFFQQLDSLTLGMAIYVCLLLGFLVDLLLFKSYFLRLKYQNVTRSEVY